MFNKKLYTAFILSFLFTLFVGFISNESNAMQKILIFVNGIQGEHNLNPIIINNRIYVPIRFVSEDLGAKVDWDNKNQTVTIDSDIKKIASIPEEGIYLYALNKKDTMYKGLILSIKGIKKVFDWETISLIEDLPELNYLDLNGDNSKELVIMLSKGRGTGSIHKTIHIINPKDFTEHKIEDPLAIIKDKVETKIISEKKVEIKINNKISHVNLDDIPYEVSGIYPKKIDKIIYKNYINYEIIDGKLRANIGVEGDDLKYIGHIIIEYSFENGEFKANNLLFQK